MSAKVGVIANPTAGHGRAAKVIGEVQRLLRAAGLGVVDMSGAGYQQALERSRAGLVAGLDAAVVVGGDGMVHLGANVLAGTQVPLGIVAVGSGNDGASALGLPVHDVEGSVRVIVEELRAGRATDIDAVAVSRPGQPVLRWYVSALCTGLDAAVADHASRLSWPRGGGRYVRSVVTELLTYAPYGYRITADGQAWEQSGALVTVANTAMIGGGMKIAPQARPDDGLLDLVVANGIGRATLVRVFPKLYSGGHVDHPAVTIRRARNVLIEPAPGHGANPPVAIADGERVAPLPLQCDVHPAALSVLGPPS